jgi:hypothetical protein
MNCSLKTYGGNCDSGGGGGVGHDDDDDDDDNYNGENNVEELVKIFNVLLVRLWEE